MHDTIQKEQEKFDSAASKADHMLSTLHDLIEGGATTFTQLRDRAVISLEFDPDAGNTQLRARAALVGLCYYGSTHILPGDPASKPALQTAVDNFADELKKSITKASERFFGEMQKLPQEAAESEEPTEIAYLVVIMCGMWVLLREGHRRHLTELRSGM